MNHIYRLIWSTSSNTWVAAPEMSKTRRKSRGAASALGLVTLISGLVEANPDLDSVVAGAVSIREAGQGELIVNQATDKAIIDWTSFSIQLGETTQFVQPSATSVALNRVVGQTPSEILGRLEANGQLYLINPNGIVFGKDSQVDVNGLVATTFDIDDDRFLEGDLRFHDTGSTAAVELHGEITIRDAGVGAFVAPAVQNAGVIKAELGRVALASGTGFTLDLYGDQLVELAVDPQSLAAVTADGESVKAVVENTGSIEAQSVFVTANTVRGLVDQVINMDGVVNATTFSQEGGRIVIGGNTDSVVISGELDASGAGGKGGQISIAADSIKLAETARLDASGETGGGSVNVGGEWQGQGPLHQATEVLMDAGAKIDVSAKRSGDGGTAVLWSDIREPMGATIAQGEILAKAGLDSGDGGRVETSGHYLNVDGINVSTEAESGDSGLWLLDPYNISIVSSNGSDTLVSGDPDSSFTSAQTSTLLASDIESALAVGNVTILTGGADGDGQGNGDISVDAPVSWSANTLSLEAHGDVVIRSTLDATNTAGLFIRAGYSTPGTAGGLYDTTHGLKVPVTNGVFDGRVNLGADTALSINDEPYTILTELGIEGSFTGGDLQGIQGGAIDGNYALGANIDASATTGWASTGGFSPIAIDGSYSGSFNGLGHTVTGLFINLPSTTNVGLFANLGAGTRVSNLGLTSADITGGSSTAILAGSTSGGVLDRVYASNINLGGSISGSTRVGSLFGSSAYTSSESVSFSGSVTSSGQYAGGAIGFDQNGALSNMKSNATVVGTSSLGGLVGHLLSTASIKNSSASGSVTSTGGSNSIGGFIGYTGLTNIADSYSTSTVQGSTSTSLAATSSKVGGFIGRIQGTPQTPSTLSNVYSTGDVTGGNQVGGLVGEVDGNTNINVVDYSNATVFGNDSVGGLVGKTTGGTNINITDASVSGVTVDGGVRVGGIVGWSDSTAVVDTDVATSTISARYSQGFVGGVAGELGSSSLTRVSVQDSTITSGSSGTGPYSGGLAGRATAASIEDISISGNTVTGATSTSGGFFGLAQSGLTLSGTLDLSNETLRATAVTLSGTLTGVGTVDLSASGTFTNNGIIQPGGDATIGEISFLNGTLIQSNTGETKLDVSSPSSYDTVYVLNDLNYDGALTVNYLGQYTPATSDSFSFLSSSGTMTIQPGLSYPTHLAIDQASLAGNTLVLYFAPVTWTGGSASAPQSWADPDNWSGTAIPVSDDYVLIPSGSGTISLDSLSALTIGKLTSNSSLELLNGTNLSVTEGVSLNGDLSLSGISSVTSGGSIIIVGDVLLSPSSYLSATAGKISLDGTLRYSAADSFTALRTQELSLANGGISGQLDTDVVNLDIQTLTLSNALYVNAATNFNNDPVDVNVSGSATGDLSIENNGAINLTSALSSSSSIDLRATGSTDASVTVSANTAATNDLAVHGDTGISGTGKLSGTNVYLSTNLIGSDIGTLSSPLQTASRYLAFGSEGAAYITNNLGQPGSLDVVGTAANDVAVVNYGATTVPADVSNFDVTYELSPGIYSTSGSIAVTANSPLTVSGTVQATSGSIDLTAANTGNLSIPGSVNGASVTLAAPGGSVTGNIPAGASVTEAPPPAPSTPTTPVVTDPVVTDPVVTDPVVTDPVVTDPIVTDPVVTDPVVTDPVVSDPVVAEPVAPAEETLITDTVPDPESSVTSTVVTTISVETTELSNLVSLDTETNAETAATDTSTESEVSSSSGPAITNVDVDASIETAVYLDSLRETFPPSENLSGEVLPSLSELSLEASLSLLEESRYTPEDRVLFYEGLTEDEVVESLLSTGDVALADFFRLTAQTGETEETDLIAILSAPLAPVELQPTLLTYIEGTVNGLTDLEEQYVSLLQEFQISNSDLTDAVNIYRVAVEDGSIEPNDLARIEDRLGLSVSQSQKLNQFAQAADDYMSDRRGQFGKLVKEAGLSREKQQRINDIYEEAVGKLGGSEEELAEELNKPAVGESRRVSYLGVYLRMRKLAMNRILEGAIAKLNTDPSLADVFSDGESGGEIGINVAAKQLTTDTGVVTLRGAVESDSKLLTLRVADRWAYIDENGQYEVEVAVQKGKQTVGIEVFDPAGKVEKVFVEIDSAANGELPVKPNRKLALVIGVEEYDYAIPELETPVNDAVSLADKLSQEQGFETLVLESPSKEELLTQLRQFSRSLEQEDSLMVYYAGHGYLMEDTKRGYWLPRDARPDDPQNWVSNRDIARLFHRTPAKQIMLISDSCYSGAFSRGRALDGELTDQSNVRLRAVMGFSSGGEQPVWDGGGDGHSIFASKLLSTIDSRERNGFSIYQEVREKVVKSSPQVPGYGAMIMPGYDDGADYLLR